MPETSVIASATTRSTRQWLDSVYSMRAPGGGYRAHEPVFGFGDPRSEPGHAQRLARVARILTVLADERFDEFLDVGAGEAYLARLVHEQFGARVAACDLSREACRRGREFFGVPTFSCDAARLPLEDRSFDLVVCSEVIEHLEDPFAAMAELLRVARAAVIITTQECARGPVERWLRLRLRDPDKPHFERNWWTLRDFPRLLGPGVTVSRQFRVRGAPDDSEKDFDRVRGWLAQAIRPEGLAREGVGALVLWRRTQAVARTPQAQTSDPSSRSLMPPSQAQDALLRRLITPPPAGHSMPAGADAWLKAKLRCPVCRSALDGKDGGARCSQCGREWGSQAGVMDLCEPRAPVAAAPEGDRAGASRSSPQTPEELQARAEAERRAVLDEAEVGRLRALFDLRNVATGMRAALCAALLALVELGDNLRYHKTAAAALREFAFQMREAARWIDPRHEGWIVRARSEQALYVIERGRRRHIVTPEAYEASGLNRRRLRVVDRDWLASLPLGEPLGAPPNENSREGRS